MGLSECLWLFLGILLFPTLSSSVFIISDGVFESQAYTGRSLLQVEKPCPVDFEFKNYTIMTSKCKGPDYPADLCCSAFKEFACPYADELNDILNACASTMFSYINLYGKYPPGLFASECREGKDGLSCPDESPSTAPYEKFTSEYEKGSSIAGSSPSIFILGAAFLTLNLYYSSTRRDAFVVLV